jgi:alkyl hydroperoxide reductase subunit AhpC
MTLAINDTAPDFEAQTTEGKIRFHDWIGNSWAVLFSHPKDFTPVCTTELGYMAKVKPEFDKRGVKIIGLSVDPLDRHSGWANDIKETQGFAPNYPMIADVDYNVSKLYGMLPAPVSGDPTKRTAGRQSDRAERLRHRPRQEDQADPGLSDDHRPQLR